MIQNMSTKYEINSLTIFSNTFNNTLSYQYDLPDIDDLYFELQPDLPFALSEMKLQYQKELQQWQHQLVLLDSKTIQKYMEYEDVEKKS